MMIYKNKAISSLLNNFDRTREASFLHLDEVYSKNDLKSKEELFTHGIHLFNDIVRQCTEREMIGVRVELHIELQSNSTELIGVPSSEQSLIDMVDDFSMPEITVSIYKEPVWPPKIELYIAPLPFNLNNISDGCLAWYEEYRTMEELKENDVYTRWLTVSYGWQCNVNCRTFGASPP